MRFGRSLMNRRPPGKTPFPPYYYLGFIAFGLAVCVWPFVAYQQNVTSSTGDSVRHQQLFLFVVVGLGAAEAIGTAVAWWLAGVRARVERRRAIDDPDLPPNPHRTKRDKITAWWEGTP